MKPKAASYYKQYRRMTPEPGLPDQSNGRWFPHVTVASIAKQDGRYLMVRETHRGHSVINQPAGHVEKGESLVDAVRRETLEETGWDFEPKYISGIYQFTATNNTTYIRFAFSGEAVEHNGALPLDPAIEEVLWLDRKALETSEARLRSQVVLKCINDFENGNHFPLRCIANL